MSRVKNALRKRCLERSVLSIVAGLIVCGPVSPSLAIISTWDGGGANGTFSNATNWVGNVSPTSDINNTDIVFAGALQPSPNLTAVFSTNSFTFNNTSTAFTFGGSQLSIGFGGLVNNSTNLQTFNNAVNFGLVATSTINAASGAITFGGNVAIAAATTLTVDGSNATTFSNITGTGVVNKNGSGTMTWSPSLTAIDCDVNINAGSLSTSAAGTTDTFSSSASININGTSTFNINDNLVLDGATLTRGSTGVLNLNSGKTLTVQNGASVNISGSQFFSTSSTINITGTGSSLVANNLSSAGSNAITVQAGGTLSATTSLNLGSGTASSITVDGTGSSISAAGASVSVGASAGNGAIILSNNSTATFGSLAIANATSPSTVGFVQLQTGADVTTSSLGIGTGVGNTTGTLAITNIGSTFTVSGAGTVTVGNTSSSSAELLVDNGAIFTSGTGTITVNTSGLIGISGGSAVFNANGNMIVNGSVTRDSTGSLNLAAGKTLTVQNGGDVTITGSYSNNTASTIIVTGTGSSFTTTSSLSFNSSSVVNVTAGGFLQGGSSVINIGQVSAATVTVDGAGSTIQSQSMSIAQGATGSLTLTNGAAATVISSVAVGSVSSPSANGTLSVLSGSIFNVGGLFVGTSTGAGSSFLTVDGVGTTFTVSSTATTSIGSSGTNIATATISNGATLFTGTGLTTINSSGLLDIPTGTFNSNGDMIVKGDVTRGPTGQFNMAAGKTLTVQDGGTFAVNGSIDFSPSTTVLVTGAGSSLTTASALILNDAVSMQVSNQGSVTVSGGSLTVGGNSTTGTLTLTDNATLNAAAAGTILNSTGTINITESAVNLGTIIDNGGTINFNSGSLTFTGNLTVGTSGLLGANLNLDSNKSVTLSGTTTINPFNTLSIDGGTLRTAFLTNNGALNFLRGTLELTGVSALTIGTGGALGSIVNVSAGKTINATSAISVASSGLLVVDDGLVNASGGISNLGEIRLMGVTPRLIGGAIVNNKLIRGDGKIESNVTNAGAAAEIRVENGNTLLLTGTNGSNTGKINMQGGTIQFSQALTNGSAGFITGHGTFITDATLTNNGQIQLSGGNSDIHSTITSANGSKITVAGSSTATFYKNVSMQTGSQFNIGSGSYATFFGNVTGTNNFAGTGTAEFWGTTSALKLVNYPGTTIVQENAALSADALRVNSLQVYGNTSINLDGTAAGVSEVKSLVIAGDGFLNLHNNDLIVNYGTGPTVYNTILQQVKEGLTLLSGSGLKGIGSTEVDAQTVMGTVLAVVDNGDPNIAGGITGLSGYTISNPATSVLVKYTWFGDCNLDGVVDGADYALVDTGFVSSGTLTGWLFGDMNFDGIVTGDDYALVDTGFIFQTGALPEPSLLGLLGLTAGVLTYRRRLK